MGGKAAERVFKPGVIEQPEGIANDKTGTAATSAIHMFTAVVGAGVLALPNAVGWLGWVAGPLLITLFYVVQTASSRILSMCYSVDGREFARYHHAVAYILGPRDSIALACFQLANPISMQDIANRVCELQGKAADDCFNSQWQLSLIFGAAEVLLSQVPSLADAWWVSFIGAVTGLIYSLIALILGCVYAGQGTSTVGGIPSSPANKAFNVLSSLGAVAFAFSFSLILLEITDTVHQPPAAAITMKKSIYIAVTAAYVLYISVACVGYAALGNDVPGMVLSGFPDAPAWVIILAQFALALAMLTSFQLFCQPVFDSVESQIKAWRLRRAGLLPPGKPADGGEAAGKADAEDGKGAGAGISRGVSQALEPRESLIHNTAPRAVLPSGAPGAGPKVRVSAGPTRQAKRAQAAAQAQSLPASPFDQVAPAAAAGEGQAAAAQGGEVGSAAMSGPVMSAGASRRVSALRQKLSGTAVGFVVERAATSMYQLGTGLANETVPLNDEHYLLPFWMRFLMRTAFVIFVTVIGTVLPFFSDIVGLIGGFTFYPLSIWFPYRMYFAVFKPQGAQLKLMYAVMVFMLLVSLAAVVGSVRGIVLNASNYTFFA